MTAEAELARIKSELNLWRLERLNMLAKRLLEGATSGPWESFGNGVYADYEDDAGKRSVLIASMYLPYKQEVVDRNAELTAAAPELAEAVACMHWEYAVEEEWLTPLGAVWRMATEAQWYSSYCAAEESADPECHTRIVRRRVSPVEAME